MANTPDKKKAPAGSIPATLTDELSGKPPSAPALHGSKPDAVAPAFAERSLNSLPRARTPNPDLTSVLMSEIATSDLAKLTRIINPTPNPVNNGILDTLLIRALEEIANGNTERAMGYLADYATRDPRRAEALPLEAGLSPVREKIDSMVSRMTAVARISAEDELSRAERSASEMADKMSDWDTSADVLIKVAQRFFDAGGYANYARTTELARLVSDLAAQTKLPTQTLAASAAASAAAHAVAVEIIPAISAPWTPPDNFVARNQESPAFITRLPIAASLEDAIVNSPEVNEIFGNDLSELWQRAPLLVMTMVWSVVGLAGGASYSLASHISSDSALATLGRTGFNAWGVGCVALLGFGLYRRVRRP